MSHTDPWRVSERAPAPADAKFAPSVYFWKPGWRYGFIKGNFPYSAAEKGINKSINRCNHRKHNKYSC